MLDEATREFRRVAELRPGEAQAHFYIGLVALKQARWREAMEALRLAAERGGSRPAVLHNLGFAFEQLGRLDEAEAAYAEAAARARTDAKVYLSWGIVALERGDLAYRGSRYDEAWDAYNRAVELAPDLGDDVYFKLGNIAYKRNDRDLAAQLWRKALEINPKHELVKANLDTLSALS